MKKTKKLICIILAAIMLASVAGLSVTAYYPYDKANHYTQIYVEGFESKWVYYPDDPNTSLLFPIDNNRLGSAFKNVGDYMKTAISNGDPQVLYHAVYDPLYSCFGDTALLPDGKTMKDCVTVDPTRIIESEANKFIFKYDTRLDPVDIAKDLNDYIEWVKRDATVTKSNYPNTVTDTIELVGSSYGSAVVLAYLNEYGWENIDSVLICVPTSNGVNFVNDLFTGDFSFNAEAIKYFLEDSNMLTEYKPIIDALVKSGALQYILDDALRPALKIALYNSLHDILHDVFATFPAFWSFVDDAHFEKALAYIFNSDEDRETYSELIAKVKNYHYNVQNNTADIFAAAKNDGVKVNIICKYNYSNYPLTTEGNVLSDGFVSCSAASYGAICADNKGTLPKNYTQAIASEYNFVSPDRMVDASTCMLPFNTWFIKDLWHGAKCDDYYDLINHILYDDLDVFTDARWPQFLTWDGAEGLNPTEPAAPTKEEKPRDTWISILIGFIKLFFSKIKGIFVK